MTRDEFYRHVAFILRCSSAAALAFLLAGAVGLPHPVWATMSGIIVSQEKLNDTNRVTLWWLTGTVVGVISAVIVAVRCWLLMLRFRFCLSGRLRFTRC